MPHEQVRILAKGSGGGNVQFVGQLHLDLLKLTLCGV